MKLPQHFKERFKTGIVIFILVALFTFCIWIDSLDTLNDFYKTAIIMGVFGIELLAFIVVLTIKLKK